MPYSLNVHAQEFVPSFLRKPVAPRQPVEPLERPSGVTTAEETEGSKTLPCTSTDEQRHYPVENETPVSTDLVEQLQEELPRDAENKEADELAEGVNNVHIGSRDRENRHSKSAAATAAMAAAAAVEPEKENMNIIFIGHVDAGKSTIGGHLMYLTGQVDKRTLEKYEREAKEKNRETWYLSWALDTNQEERDKGKTVEVGRAAFDTESKHISILDAPGHRSFVPNMIGGAQQADVGILVISARKGEFETGFERGGQTREHAMLAKTAGVRHLVVLVNKMDDPTVEWSEERYEECKTKLTPFLKKVGFNPKTG
jgi:peptide chain release factor subunit 3